MVLVKFLWSSKLVLLHNFRLLTANVSFIASVIKFVEFVKSMDPQETRSLSKRAAKAVLGFYRS